MTGGEGGGGVEDGAGAEDEDGAEVDAVAPTGDAAATAGADTAVLAELFAVIEDRRETLPEDSYTASLFTHEKGENAVLEKLGEETTELLLAAKDDDREELAAEAADLVYHLLVLLAMEGVGLDELLAELRDRR